MRTILDNDGNCRLFRKTYRQSRSHPERRHGFTVNVQRPTSKLAEYGSGFHDGPDAYRKPYERKARWWRRVKYRIRVIPKVPVTPGSTVDVE